MFTTTTAIATALAALMAASVPNTADGHAYMRLPVSRQYSRSRAFHDDGYGLLETMPYAYSSNGQQGTRARGMKVTDPDLLKEYGNGWYPLKWAYEKGEMAVNGNYKEPKGIEVRKGVCGDPRQAGAVGANEDLIVYGTPNAEWPILTEYVEGGVIEIETVSTAAHWGHFEYLMCNADDLDDPDGVVTEECLDMHPLNRVDDGPDDSPIDPAFPGRYYADAPCLEQERDQSFPPRAPRGHIMVQKYQLPAGLTCERCILRMTWYTGHKCMHPGYDEFNPPSWPSKCAPNKGDWILTDKETCGDSLKAYAQEFAGCADIRIVSGVRGAAPAPIPVVEPLAMPEESPMADPVAAPVETASTYGTSTYEGMTEVCTEEVEPYEECGAKGQCCVEGYDCTEMKAGCYSQCRLMGDY